jgi:hypothetical protein
MRRPLLFIAVPLLLVSSVAWALMPPHVDRTNIQKDTLVGDQLILHGYSLEYTNVKKDLSLTNTQSKKPAKWTHTMKCTWEGKCDDERPGSCQLKCVLTVTLDKANRGATLHLKYLDVDETFRVERRKKP